LKKVLVLALSFLVFTTLATCKNEYTGEYIEWGEKTNSNVAELLENNDILYEIRGGIIYIPEDAFDKAIYCCTKFKIVSKFYLN